MGDKTEINQYRSYIEVYTDRFRIAESAESGGDGTLGLIIST